MNYKLRTIFYFIITLAGVFYILSISPYAGFYWDDAVYMCLAKSICMGNGYREIFYPGNFLNMHYPPVFPLLLVPAFMFSNNVCFNIFLCKFTNIILLLSSLIILYFYIRTKTSEVIALIVLFLTAFHFQTLLLADSILSEIAYLFLSSLALLLFEKKKNFFLIFIFSILAFYTRSLGIALGASFLLYLFLQKKYDPLLIYSFFFSLFIIPGLIISSNGGYITEGLYSAIAGKPDLSFVHSPSFLKLFFILNNNLRLYFLHYIPDILLPMWNVKACIWSSIILILRAFLCIGGIFIGILNKVRHDKSAYSTTREKITPLELYIIIYIGICLLWHWPQFRFLWPLLPFLYLYFLIGIQKLFQTRLFFKHYKILFSLSLFILFLLQLFLARVPSVNKLSRGLSTPSAITLNQVRDSAKDFYSAFSWIKYNTPDSSLLFSDNPPLFYIYTQRKSVGSPASSPASSIEQKDAMLKFFLEVKPDYVILTDLASFRNQGQVAPNYSWQLFAYKLLKKYPDNFHLLYENNSVAIYGVSL